MEYNTTSPKIKILIADDYLLLRTAWKLLLQSNPDFVVVGTTGDGKATIDFIRGNRVDIVLMDINMPNKSGIETTFEINNIAPWIKVIGLSMHNEIHYVNKMMKAGAKGFVTKSADKEELFKAISSVYNNIPYISPLLSHNLLGRLAEDNCQRKKTELSNRELDIIKYIIQGRTSRQIGEELSISFKTVEAHKCNIFKKLEVNNSVSMTKKVLEEGIVLLPNA
jgi:DNA-binding NarL/FixJ family response regulator